MEQIWCVRVMCTIIHDEDDDDFLNGPRGIFLERPRDSCGHIIMKDSTSFLSDVIIFEPFPVYGARIYPLGTRQIIPSWAKNILDSDSDLLYWLKDEV